MNDASQRNYSLLYHDTGIILQWLYHATLPLTPTETPLAPLKRQELLALALKLEITVERWGDSIPFLEVDLSSVTYSAHGYH